MKYGARQSTYIGVPYQDPRFEHPGYRAYLFDTPLGGAAKDICGHPVTRTRASQ
jgi:hypothetical protein